MASACRLHQTRATVDPLAAVLNAAIGKHRGLALLGLLGVCLVCVAAIRCAHGSSWRGDLNRIGNNGYQQSSRGHNAADH